VFLGRTVLYYCNLGSLDSGTRRFELTQPSYKEHPRQLATFQVVDPVNQEDVVTMNVPPEARRSEAVREADNWVAKLDGGTMVVVKTVVTPAIARVSEMVLIFPSKSQRVLIL